MDQSGEFLWSFFLHKKKSDVLSPSVKIVIISWWVLETKISPNKKEITWRQIIAPHVADEKYTHYLMETQVSNSSLLSLVSCISLSVFHY